MVEFYKSGASPLLIREINPFEKSREQYRAENDNALRLFYMAERKLKPHYKNARAPSPHGARSASVWNRNIETGQTELSYSMRTQKSSGQSNTRSTECSMSRSDRTPLHGRKSRKSNTKEGIAY